MTSKKPANNNAACPICKQLPETEKYLPFCSARCADIDLGRWLKGSYAIPTNEAPTVISSDEEDY
ncbi:DNA gyrase inhibitor YacG [Emcibacter sp.]|uniref:DNA gyrase inhibitor YacG n=1 Tax=Emcibacter sp. TaxID=1979954 RepID=UPI002AA68ADC|nr:DNA gyrase inhibitor YacG [Emcibacter sp.]